MTFFALTETDVENVAGVYDRAALIALPPAMRQDYVEHLLGILPPVHYPAGYAGISTKAHGWTTL
ncbi:MAG: hypothetical protein R3F37_09810 [Candidatus Competibacteraceae bacterium]